MNLRHLWKILWVVLGLYFLTQLPPLKLLVLEQVLGQLAQRSIHLSYDSFEMNPWFRLELTGCQITGPGVEATLERIELRYNLASMFQGVLELNLHMEQGEAFIERKKLQAAFADSGGGGVPVRLASVSNRGLELVGSAL